MRVVTSVSLSEEMASDLEMFTRDPVKTKSEIIMDTLKAYLWESQFLDLRKVLRPEAEAEGLLTDEEPLRFFLKAVCDLNVLSVAQIN